MSKSTPAKRKKERFGFLQPCGANMLSHCQALLCHCCEFKNKFVEADFCKDQQTHFGVFELFRAVIMGKNYSTRYFYLWYTAHYKKSRFTSYIICLP